MDYKNQKKIVTLTNGRCMYLEDVPDDQRYMIPDVYLKEDKQEASPPVKAVHESIHQLDYCTEELERASKEVAKSVAKKLEYQMVYGEERPSSVYGGALRYIDYSSFLSHTYTLKKINAKPLEKKNCMTCINICDNGPHCGEILDLAVRSWRRDSLDVYGTTSLAVNCPGWKAKE